MPDKNFKTCIINGYEQYAIVNPESQTAEFRTERFPGSLLSFVDIDMDTITPLFSELSTKFKQLTDSSAPEALNDILRTLDTLSEHHIYFELFRLEWRGLIGRSQSACSLQKLWRKDVRHLPEDLVRMQHQIRDLFARTLDIDVESASVPERLASYARTESAFQFLPQSTSYELWNSTVFVEVLYPRSIPEIISYHLQECVKRKLRMRICRNCGRYFPVTGRSTAIYCHRPFGKGGGTCNGVGPVYAWTQKRKSDEVFMDYRREYKRRFAWIKSGRISRDEFYAWSKLALEKKKECDAGTLPCKSFFAWLRQS